MKNIIKGLICLVLFLSGCGKDNGGDTPPVPKPDVNTLLVTQKVLTNSYLGNGPQWGGYDIVNAQEMLPYLNRIGIRSSRESLLCVLP